MVPYLIVSLLDMLSKESIATALHYLFCFINPVYVIFGGFYYIDKMHRNALFYETTPSASDYFSFDSNIPICLIVVSITVFLIPVKC